MTLNIHYRSWCIAGKKCLIFNFVWTECTNIQVEHIDVSLIHADEEMVVVERLRGQKTRNVEATHLAIAWMWNLNLDLAI